MSVDVTTGPRLPGTLKLKSHAASLAQRLDGDFGAAVKAKIAVDDARPSNEAFNEPKAESKVEVRLQR